MTPDEATQARPLKALLRGATFVVAASLLSAQLGPVAAHAPQPDTRFGAVEAYMAPDRAAEDNVGWDRMILHWAGRQANGPHEWTVASEETAHIAAAQAAGREVVALLMSTPAWATDGGASAGVPRGLYLPVDDPGNLWAAFVRRVVAEHSGVIRHWIIWNEPDIAPGDYGVQFEGTVVDYYQLLKVAALAAREANPNAVVHLAGLTYWHDVVHKRPPYLQRLLEVAAKDKTAPANGHYFDILTLHIYFRTETVPEIVSFYQRLLRRHGLKKTIWLNETNAAPSDDPLNPATPIVPVTMDEQASFIIQANALALGLGVERVAVYKFIDSAPLPPGLEPYGLYRVDGAPRPAAAAFRVVTTHFAGVQAANLLTRATHYSVVLKRGSAVTTVLWSRVGREVVVRVRPARGALGALLYDHFGALHAIAPDAQGQYRLSLPAADCSGRYGCAVGGAPWILVETFPPP